MIYLILNAVFLYLNLKNYHETRRTLSLVGAGFAAVGLASSLVFIGR